MFFASDKVQKFSVHCLRKSLPHFQKTCKCLFVYEKSPVLSVNYSQNFPDSSIFLALFFSHYFSRIFSTHIFHAYFPRIFSTHIFHAYFPRIFSTHIFHAYFPRIFSTHIFHAYFSRIFFTHIFHAYFSRIFFTHIFHAYFSCIFFTHIFHAYFFTHIFHAYFSRIFVCLFRIEGFLHELWTEALRLTNQNATPNHQNVAKFLHRKISHGNKKRAAAKKATTKNTKSDTTPPITVAFAKSKQTQIEKARNDEQKT